MAPQLTVGEEARRKRAQRLALQAGKDKPNGDYHNPDADDPPGEPARLKSKAKRPAPEPEPAPQVETFTAGDLLKAELPEPRWAVPGIIPEGLCIVAGKPKMGKSWLVLQTAIAVAAGGSALGNIEVEAGDVLYLALEDSRRRLQSRLRKIIAPTDRAAPERLTLATHWPRLGDDLGLLALLEWLTAHPAARLVVIDTLAKIRRQRIRSNGAYEDDYQDVGELKTLADKFGVAIVVVHHTRKMEAADAVDTVSGTLGLTGAADGVLVLKRERGQHDATLFVTGRDLDERELALQWDPQYALWSILGGAEEFRVSRERKSIIDLLAKAGKSMTPTEVAGLLDKKAGSVKKLLWTMAQDGQVSSTGDGKYASGNPGNPSNPSFSDGHPGTRQGYLGYQGYRS